MSTHETHRRVTDRVLAVLNALSKADDLDVHELSERTKIPASTVYRILAATNDAGFTRRVATGRYSAGPGSIPLAQRYREHALKHSAVAPQLEKLVADSGELAAFLIPYGNEALCVEAVETHRTLRCSFSTGATQPLLHGATATALLSRLSHARRQRTYAHYDLDTSTLETIEHECNRAITDGYAVSTGVLDPGVWGASAPVIDADGALLGTVTIMAPELRVQGRTNRLIDMVCRTSDELSGGKA